jgi:hypothetical protein
MNVACLWSGLARRRGNLTWDGVVRGTGVLALAGLVTALRGGASAVGLIGFLVVTIWVNGPLGMFMPATYEPILILFGRVYPPLVVGLVGIVGTVYVEFLNYHLYAKVLHARQLTGIREHPVVQRIVPLFTRAPFFTVWLASWSPLPYWSVRILGPLAGYPIGRYLVATFLGRFPRLWFFAALGALPIPRGVLLPAMLIAVALALVLVFIRPLVAAARGGLRRPRSRLGAPVLGTPVPEEVSCGP